MKISLRFYGISIVSCHLQLTATKKLILTRVHNIGCILYVSAANFGRAVTSPDIDSTE